MPSFSERQGLVPKKPIQFESMDEDLRTGLWNALHIHFWSHTRLGGMNTPVADKDLEFVVKYLWVNSLKWPLNKLPWDWADTEGRIQEHFDTGEWYQVYDFIEFIAPMGDQLHPDGTHEFTNYCNGILETEQSAYRFVNGIIVPITSVHEIEAVETALISPNDQVRIQIESAVTKLSAKPTPDFRNCIKESIGAVETAARLASGDKKGTLGKLLLVLKNKLDLHPSQVEGFSKLYGYTNDDESGIRHGMMDKDDLTADDARYMLVTCSAFANYLLRLAERAKE